MSAPSVHIAKDRLHHLLMADRMKCTPDMAEKLSRDMYHTIAKYIEIRPENFQLKITRSDIHIKYTGENY
ncbi:MAG: cell division topological specificity factor MinE [Ruminococcus sp.]|nr:cell division topological specificity factor MinE [Ruminococcus sp.]